MKIPLQLLIAVCIASHCSGSVLYSNNFDTPTSLDGLTIGQFGSANVILDGGRLRIDPGQGFLNRGFAALNTSAIPGYNSVLSSNPAVLIWAFNVSNSDGGLNNAFEFGIFSSPDSHDSTGFGYKVRGGIYVGNRMLLNQSALAFSPFGPVSKTIVDTPNGLGRVNTN